jgi:high-affinity K+ transport system ATPase subunit B
MARSACNDFSMKLYQVAWVLGMLSLIVSGALRRSSSPLAELSFEMQRLITWFLVIIPAGIGALLSVISLIRKEVSVWWILAIAVMNVAMLLGGVIRLLPD